MPAAAVAEAADYPAAVHIDLAASVVEEGLAVHSVAEAVLAEGGQTAAAEAACCWACPEEGTAFASEVAYCFAAADLVDPDQVAAAFPWAEVAACFLGLGQAYTAAAVVVAAGDVLAASAEVACLVAAA